MHNFAKIRTLCINCLWQTTHPFVCSWNGVSDLEEKEERKWEGNKLEREIIEMKEERGKKYEYYMLYVSDSGRLY